MKAFRFSVPTEIVFASGCLDTLAGHSQALGTKALVVTGCRSARKSGVLDRVLAHLPGATLLEGIDENPGDTTCDEGAGLCRQSGCDHIIALGGGSPIDAAKAIAVLATNGGRCADYFGNDRFGKTPLPVVAIPTTAGTGSEVTPYAVLVDTKEGAKRTVGGRGLFPRTALLDPDLTRTLPRDLTINTGLDALSQAMEGMLSLNATPIGDALALEVCRTVRAWLPRAAEAPEDSDARSAMLYAAMLSGCIIAQSGTTLVHGMGYQYTLEFGVPHGLANALLLAPVFALNARYEAQKVALVAEALGNSCEAVPEAAARAIGVALHAFLRELGVSPAAEDAGVEEGRLETLARNVYGEPGRFKNQLGTLSEGDVRRLYELSFKGIYT